MVAESRSADPTVGRAADALRVVAEADASSLVDRALAMLEDVGQSENVMFYRVAATSAGPAVARWGFRGSERGCTAMNDFTARASKPGGDRSLLIAWDLSRIERAETNGFLES